MGTVEVDGKTFEVLGIDVDHYEDVDAEGNIKQKRGYDELIALQKRLGKLPATWTSSARTDGKSGTRFFLVPAGLKWPGKIGSNIDIVQVVHRYSMVYPSYHPTQGQCEWYRPGDVPDGTHTIPYAMTTTPVEGGNLVRLTPGEDVKIPDARTLPLLPKKWAAELTRGIVDEGQPADMVSSRVQIDAWAAENLPREEEACSATTAALERHKVAIEADPSSHDKITAGHWELLRLAMEGHHGWQAATSELDTFWRVNVVKRGKRGPQGAAGEVFRSRTNALRKIKGEVDAAAENEINLLGRSCTCFDESLVDYEGFKPAGTAKAPDEYEAEDDGNAEHLRDLYGDDLRYLEAYDQWVLWDGQKWEQTSGTGRRAWRAVKKRQQSYVKQLGDQVASAKARGDDKEESRLKAVLREWKNHAKSSGTNRGADNALRAAQSLSGVVVKPTMFDSNERLLGVANGVIELNPDGAALREVRREDYVTRNTGVPYVSLVDQMADPELKRGVELLRHYLDTFIPDMELRAFVQKTLGYCLLGRNSERLVIFLYGGTSTGKSTLLEAVMAALGEYASSIRPEMLMGQQRKDLNPELAYALPRRIVTTSEAGAAKLNAEAFKRITGSDEISVELKGSNEIIRRVPAFTPVFATNHPPEVEKVDDGAMRRVMTIPFNEQVARGGEDHSASEELRNHGHAAVLAWLVEGWNAYAQEGLSPEKWPDAVKKETDEFITELDQVKEFADETFIADRDAFITSEEIHSLFVQWCGAVPGREAISWRTLSGRLSGLGLQKDKKRIHGSKNALWGFHVRLLDSAIAKSYSSAR